MTQITQITPLEAMAHGLYEGLSGGFSDEIGGQVQGLVFGALDKAKGKSFAKGWRRGYYPRRDRLRRDFERAEKAYPTLTGTGELLGGAAGAVSPAFGVGVVAKTGRLKRALNNAKGLSAAEKSLKPQQIFAWEMFDPAKAVRNMGVAGGIYGSLLGAGKSTGDLSETLSEGVRSGLEGAALGVLGAKAGMVADNLKNRALRSDFLRDYLQSYARFMDGFSPRYAGFPNARYEIFGYRNDPFAAVARLLKETDGYIRHAVGPIDLLVGDERTGLQHIIEQRNARGLDGEKFVREKLPAALMGKTGYNKKYPGRVIVNYDGDPLVVLGRNKKGDFHVVTAYPDPAVGFKKYSTPFMGKKRYYPFAQELPDVLPTGTSGAFVAGGLKTLDDALAE